MSVTRARASSGPAGTFPSGWLRPPSTFAYLTGWRLPSEVLPLTWTNVNLEIGAVRLDPGTTKTKVG